MHHLFPAHFRYTDFSELGIELPQLPYNLHPQAGQRKFPKHSEEKIKDFGKGARVVDDSTLLYRYVWFKHS